MLPIDKDEVEFQGDNSDAEDRTFDFPWPLVTTCKNMLEMDQKQTNWIWSGLTSPRLRLIMWGIIFVLSLIAGFVGLMGSCPEEEKMMFLLSQGAFGAYISLMDMIRIWFR